jgi:hypothetical protein
MLETLTIETFAPHVGETFRMLVGAGQVIELELLQVTPVAVRMADGTEATQGRRPFSLLFRGPANPLATQRMYPIEHAAIGISELFVVPVGPGQGGMLYEIIFA